jgi:chemotaxis protein CheZ
MRDADLQRARELVAALEQGDEALYESLLTHFMRERDRSLFVSVARLTRELHRAITDTRLDARLLDLAKQDLPDACSRLDYVVQLTEEAAHRTLDLVDQGRSSVERLRQASALLADLPPVPGLPAIRSTLDGSIHDLRGQLTQLAQAQEYQDLSGQLIKRVTNLVRGLESALLQLLQAAGTAGVVPPPQPLDALQGPQVPGLGSAPVSQKDADALLSSLGF